MKVVFEQRKSRTLRVNDSVFLLKSTKSELPKNDLSVDDLEYWRAMANRLDNSVVCNDITMQEIVDEVNIVRKEHHEKRNRI
jgi:hypothetical protein